MNDTIDTPGDAGSMHATLQTAEAVLMVRPANFAWNAETEESNRFQRADPVLAEGAQAHALAEFEGLVGALRAAGVAVCTSDDEPAPQCPDAIFPNNWVSLHADGTVVLYPMLAPSRRRERRLEHLWRLELATGRRVRRLLDLTHYELRGQFLEGTGSVVFDHVARVAYAALSPRTHVAPLEELCAELGYRSCSFAAADASGAAVYHTNVMLAIGSGFAVLATDAVAAGARERVLAALRDSAREVFPIDAAEMERFAGNVLELRADDGARVLAMSQVAAAAFGPVRLEALRGHVDRIVTAPIPTIEALGGGSVRCMLAEVFLPR
ncbi:MAG TPA: arginine deiminase-related protein [Steroidobacteraceae bacterium]|nr:arginine deiminase-related protein [Steroidobacteraceae bacterium]